MSTGRRIQLEGLLPTSFAPTKTAPSAGNRSDPFLTEAEMQQRDRSNLVAALRHAAGKVSGDGGAAELLGIKASTLGSRIKKYQIERGEYLDC
jgi:transcriptional regulator with GAF, ATPase, and Fis domain